MGHAHGPPGAAQIDNGIRRTGQPDGHGAVGGIAAVPLGADQFLGAILIDRQVGGFGTVFQQQMTAAAQLGRVGGGLARFLLVALGVLDRIRHFFSDGGGTGRVDRRILGALVDLAGLDNLFLDGFHVRFIHNFFLYRHGGALRHQIPLDGLYRYRVLAGVHILRQGGTGLGIQRIVGGLPFPIGQRDGGFHAQQRHFIGSLLSLIVLGRGFRGGGAFFRLFRQRIELHTHILLDHTHVGQQFLGRFGSRFRGGRRRNHRRGRGFRGRFRRSHRGEGGRKHSQPDTGRQDRRRTTRNQFVQRQPRKGVAGKILHGIALVEHPYLTISLRKNRRYNTMYRIIARMTLPPQVGNPPKKQVFPVNF